jgi:hypothetical protein
MMGVKNFGVRDGVLRFTTDTNDPALSAPALRLRGGKFSRFVVGMRVSRGADAQVFWTTTAVPSANERSSMHAQVPADGQFHRVVFEVGRDETWGGCVTGLRFDPTDQPGVVVEIKSISLE